MFDTPRLSDRSLCTKGTDLGSKLALDFRGFVVKAAKLEQRQDVGFVLVCDIKPMLRLGAALLIAEGPC
jgi:hypothetical protein